jgi:hypothetical protein
MIVLARNLQASSIGNSSKCGRTGTKKRLGPDGIVGVDCSRQFILPLADFDPIERLAQLSRASVPPDQKCGIPAALLGVLDSSNLARLLLCCPYWNIARFKT